MLNMAVAEQTLREILNDILHLGHVKEWDIKVKSISTDGANYTSNLYLVNVLSPDGDDLKLFTKVACIGEFMRTHMNSNWLYSTERFVYTKLTDIYEDIQDQNKVPDEHRFIFPKFYGFNDELGRETIVLENLIETGYKSFDRFRSMDWEHASVSVETLAKFHALSFAFEKYYPEEYNKYIPTLKYSIAQEVSSESLKAVWTRMIDSALEVIKEEQQDTVRMFVTNNKLIDKFNKPIGKPVISHGDYRLSNLLFRRQNGVLQSIAVDYQTVHAGCPAGDLIYFIFLGSDEEFRREHYQRLLDHYYSSLERALERLAVDPSVYTREKFDSDIKELLPYAVLMGVSVLPVVTVDVESAPRVEGDADVSIFALKPNKLFAERFSGIVNDCIRWGAI